MYGKAMGWLNAALFLLLILQITGCGGWSMNATVVGEDGGAIPGVSVEVRTKSGTPVAKIQTDENGVFKVGGLDRHRRYKVSLVKETVRSDEIEYNLNMMSKKQISSLRIQLDEVAVIRGKVSGLLNQSKFPVQGAVVELVMEWLDIERIQRHLSTETDPDGNFEINGITKDGKYRLNIIERNFFLKEWPAMGYHELKVGDVWNIDEIVLEPIPTSEKINIDAGTDSKPEIKARPIHD